MVITFKEHHKRISEMLIVYIINMIIIQQIKQNTTFIVVIMKLFLIVFMGLLILDKIIYHNVYFDLTRVFIISCLQPYQNNFLNTYNLYS